MNYKFYLDLENNCCNVHKDNFNAENYLGQITIDHTGAWSVSYADGVRWLPINTALEKLGYQIK